MGGGKFRKFGRGGGISCGVSIARGFLMSSSAIATVGAGNAFLPDLRCYVIADVESLTCLF